MSRPGDCENPLVHETVIEIAAPELDGLQLAPAHQRALDECEWKDDNGSSIPTRRGPPAKADDLTR